MIAAFSGEDIFMVGSAILGFLGVSLNAGRDGIARSKFKRSASAYQWCDSCRLAKKLSRRWIGRGVETWWGDIRMRARGKVDEGKIPRRIPSDMDAGRHDGNFASLAMIRAPWLLVICLGLFFSIIPREARATPDTCWLSDIFIKVNTRGVGGDHLPGVFHRSARTG